MIRNKQELENQKRKIKKGLYSILEIDAEIITSFDTQSDEYGPLILIVEEYEKQDIFKRYPVLLQVIPEDEELVYIDDNEEIYRVCYILSEAGFIVYLKRRRKNV